MDFSLDYYTINGTFVAREIFTPSASSGMTWPTWRHSFWFRFKQFWLCERNPDKVTFTKSTYTLSNYGLSADRTFTFPEISATWTPPKDWDPDGPCFPGWIRGKDKDESN